MKADNSKLLAIQKLIITMLVIIFSIPISLGIQKTTVHADTYSDWAQSIVNSMIISGTILFQIH